MSDPHPQAGFTILSQAWRLAPLVLLGSALGGCGGSDSSSPPPSPPPAAVNTVTGVASKGPLSGAQLCAYAISNGAKGAAIGNCAVSSATGNYTLDLGSYTGPVLLEATGGSYVDEATGTTVSLATPLRSLLAQYAGGSATLAVTPLTELATQLGLAATGGLSAANIQSAVAAVQSNFGVGDILATQPVDALNLPASASADQKAYTLALATVSQYLQAQPAGATVASALQSLSTCLSTAGACGSLATDLASAMSSFQAAHAGYAGLSLPTTGFGGVPDLNGGSGNPGGTGAGTPVVASYAPSSGAVGTTVTLSGTNLGSFTPAPLVKFGTATATVSSATSTSIVVTVPADLAAGSSAITVSNGDGTGVVSVGSFSVAASGGSGNTTLGTAANGSPRIDTSQCGKLMSAGTDMNLALYCAANSVADFTNVTVIDQMTDLGTCTASYRNGLLTVSKGALSASATMNAEANDALYTWVGSTAETIQILAPVNIGASGTTADVAKVSWKPDGTPFFIQGGTTAIGGVYQLFTCMIP